MYDTCKTTNYLYKQGYWYWLLTPLSGNVHSVLNCSSGVVGKASSYYQNGSVHPALYIKSNITLTGNGTNDENIYKIS